MQVVSSVSAEGDSGEKRKAEVTDMQVRHEAFLRRDEAGASFKPKQQPRSSVVKILSLMDNQALPWLGVSL